MSVDRSQFMENLLNLFVYHLLKIFMEASLEFLAGVGLGQYGNTSPPSWSLIGSFERQAGRALLSESATLLSRVYKTRQGLPLLPGSKKRPLCCVGLRLPAQRCHAVHQLCTSTTRWALFGAPQSRALMLGLPKIV